MERYAQLSLVVRELIDESELPASAVELLELWCRLSCNSHAILDTELEDVGVGIYIGLSQLNHSCYPNCTIVFDGTTAIIRSLCAINPGEEVNCIIRITKQAG
jgi:SET and MYND domain-containing protein